MLVTEWSLRNPFDFFYQWLFLLSISQTRQELERVAFPFSNHADQNRHQLGEHSSNQSRGTDQNELVEDVHHSEVQLERFSNGQKLAVRILKDVRKQLEVLSISRVVILLPKLAHFNELELTHRKKTYQFHRIDSE